MANYHTGQKSYMSGAGAARRVEDKARAAWVAKVKLRSACRALKSVGVAYPDGAENKMAFAEYVYDLAEDAGWYWDAAGLCWRDALSANISG